MSEPSDLRAIIGGNVKRLRRDRGMTLEHMARGAQTLGLPWSESTVADIEAGRRSPTLPTLLALAAILGAGRPSWPVRLSELLEAPEGERFTLSGPVSVPVQDAQAALSGEPVELRPLSAEQAQVIRRAVRRGVRDLERVAEQVPSPTLGELDGAHESVGLPERRAGRALGVPALAVAILSMRQWGRSFTSERDHRAGEGATAQKRGRVTRELVAELRELLRESRRGGASGEY